MSKTKTKFKKPDLPHPFNRRLDECLARVSTFQAAQDLWDTVLSVDEKKELVRESEKTVTVVKRSRKGKRKKEDRSGFELDMVYEQFQAIGMFMKTRGIDDPYKAAVKIGEQIDFLTPQAAKKLLLALGEKPQNPSKDKPSLDRLNGCLMFRNERIKNIQSRKQPTNLEIILKIFEQKHWSHQVESPPDWDEEKIRETLKTLNHRLKTIKFERRSGSKIIQWRIA